MLPRRNNYDREKRQLQDEEDARLAYMVQSLHEGLRRALNCCREAYLIVDEFIYLAEALQNRVAAKTDSRQPANRDHTDFDDPVDRIPF